MSEQQLSSNKTLLENLRLIRPKAKFEYAKDHYLMIGEVARDAADEIERLQQRVALAKTLINRVTEWEPAFPVEASLLDDLGAFLQGAAGSSHEPNSDIRALFNKAIGVQLGNCFSFSFETEDEANRAFHYIGELGTLETSQPPRRELTQESKP